MKHLALFLLVTLSTFATELTITTQDGFKLYGWLEKPQNSIKAVPLILFVHQFGSEHSSWNDLAKKFNNKGYATLAVDLRGHGKSIYQNDKENKVLSTSKLSELKMAVIESDKKVGFAKIPQDLIKWLGLVGEDKSLDMDKLYFFGSSLGGGALVPLLNDYEAKALVTLSTGAITSLKEDTEIALSTSMTKELFIAAKNDPLGAQERSLAYVQRSNLGMAIIVSGEGHGTVLLPQVEDYIFTFMNSVK